jgi:uncharacterized protein (DUF433 family)
MLLMDYNTWRQRLVQDPSIMGGEVVFPGTRLTVHHVGSMLEHGADVAEIVEDYPYLSGYDILFARVFLKEESERVHLQTDIA